MTIPLSSPDALAHSEKLIRHIRHDIEKSGGYISFARFMELALYAPGLGYYSAGSHKLGKGGDFITAPELSPLFGHCIARQCQQILLSLGTGDILEIGAGTGALAQQVLLELEKLGTSPSRYLILEVSAELRERQQQYLAQHCPHWLSRITWLDNLPTAFTGIILANEVMDAFPVHCFRIEEQAIKERSVTWDKNAFVWHNTEPGKALQEYIDSLQTQLTFPAVYESEINLMLPAWISSLAASLKKGMILLFDYGYGRREYYHPDRQHGTLMCFYQHHPQTDPFQRVGLQDITAHVDFTSVIESADTSGLSLCGYTTQAAFLLACGLLDLAEQPLSTLEQYQQNQAIKVLTLPSQMGELVKVMALGKELDISLLGFTLQDRRRDL